MECTKGEGERLVAEFMAKLASRPVKATYDLATLGATTQQGGKVVTASTDMQMDGHRIACVGDVVRYPDGIESMIISGAGAALFYNDRPVAIVGSATDNGDIIISSLQSSAQIQELPTMMEYLDCCNPAIRHPVSVKVVVARLMQSFALFRSF